MCEYKLIIYYCHNSLFFLPPAPEGSLLGTLRSNPFNQFPEAACNNRDYAVPDALKPPSSSTNNTLGRPAQPNADPDTKPYYQTHIYGPSPSLGPMAGFMMPPPQGRGGGGGGYPMPTSFHPQLQHQMQQQPQPQQQHPPVETPYDVTEILKNTHIQGVSG